jgi:hypothetical protein
MTTASPAAAAAWHDWASIGAPPSGYGGVTPAVTSRPTGECDLVTLSGGNVYHRWYTPSNGWSPYGSLGSPGSGVNSLGIAARPTGQLYVFVSDSSGIVWQRTWTSSTGWQAWAKVGTAPYGNVRSVAAAARTDGHIDLVGRGTNGNVYQRSQATHGGAWAPWGNLGTPAGGIYGYPAVAARAGLDVVVSSANTNLVYRKFWRAATGWTGWNSEGAPNPDEVTLGVATTWRQNNTSFDIYAQDGTGDVWRKPWGSTGGFRPWADLSQPFNVLSSSDPLAAWRYTGQLDIFIQDANTGVVYWMYYG